MSFFDDIRTKIEEFTGGATDQVSGVVDDVTAQAGGLGVEVPPEVEEIKSKILPGDQQNGNEQ